MSPKAIFFVFIAYTSLLFLVSWITSRNATNKTFFVGNKQSPWFIVAYGMVGASLSGVTFISVPGWVGTTQFSYMMVVFGYLVGYFVIAKVLLPLYYKYNLTSIYSYLETRFGFWSYKTGAFYFLLSRIIGASFRMFLVVNVLQIFVFDAWNIPFGVTIALFILLIWLYTFKGGIKTIVWTDTLQTTFMLLAVGISIYLVSKGLKVNLTELVTTVADSDYSKMIVTDWQSKQYWLKQFISGVFIAIVMTGLDQDMMQKNLSCRNLKDAQKNILTLSWILVPVNLLFLFLGASLFLYASQKGIQIPTLSDDLFPTIAIKHLGLFAGLTFIIGLIAAAYSSADSALTALTTSFSVDFLNIEKKSILSEKEKIKIRTWVHVGISIIVLVIIILFRAINDEAIIAKLFTIAGYTYGPLLGLFAFGLFTKYKVKDDFVPYIALASPIICYFISEYSEYLFFGNKIGFELLIVNGSLMFMGLFFFRMQTTDS
ncbi:MAG: sodium:solute symporter [Bacteroidales bacterium]|nr:sodium:solute symporter [Bacteroidales bacterium]MCF8402390.1 sodium:solute symporter [Bacteroidales bacterium]